MAHYDRFRESRGGLGRYPYFYGIPHQHANRSSGSRNLRRSGCSFGWLSLLSASAGLILV
ncbi:hypothetical protein AtEden1_Chr5g0109391 [Arabidopsis thaliana]